MGRNQQKVGNQDDDNLDVIEFWPKRTIFGGMERNVHRSRKGNDLTTAAGETGNITQIL